MNPFIVTVQALIVISGLTIGSFILAKYPKSRMHQIAFALYWLAAGWVASELIGDYFESTSQFYPSLLLRNIDKTFASFMTATIVCFAWYFPQRSPNVRAFHIALVYLMALIFAVGGFVSDYDIQNAWMENRRLKIDYGILHRIYSAYILVCAIYSLKVILY